MDVVFVFATFSDFLVLFLQQMFNFYKTWKNKVVKSQHVLSQLKNETGEQCWRRVLAQ